MTAPQCIPVSARGESLPVISTVNTSCKVLLQRPQNSFSEAPGTSWNCWDTRTSSQVFKNSMPAIHDSHARGWLGERAARSLGKQLDNDSKADMIRGDEIQPVFKLLSLPQTSNGRQKKNQSELHTPTSSGSRVGRNSLKSARLTKLD